MFNLSFSIIEMPVPPRGIQKKEVKKNTAREGLIHSVTPNLAGFLS